MSNDTINQILICDTIEGVWDIQCAAMSSFGFDRLMYGYTQFPIGATLGYIEDAVLMTRHDPAYVDKFIGEKMYRQGPMIRWAIENEGSCSWRLVHELIEQNKLSEDELKMVQINMSMGVLAGYTISFHGHSTRSKGALGLTAREGLTQDEVDKIWLEHGKDIELISGIMHLKMSQLPHMNMRKPLTLRQTEVLYWISQGKTLRDTAAILALSQATVEKHLRLARAALNVDSTPQAILKANSLNQFILLDNQEQTAGDAWTR